MLINWIRFYLSKKIMPKTNMSTLNTFLLYKIAVLEVDIVQISLANWWERNNKTWKYKRKSIRNNTSRKLKRPKRRLKKLKIT
jgi:hypothetical protein